MKLAVIGAALLAAGVVAALTGVLPAEDVAAIGERVWPILLFVVAITIVAELAAIAGLFDVVAAFLARLSGGRTWTLWLLVVALAVVCTAVSLRADAATQQVFITDFNSTLPPQITGVTTLESVQGLAGIGNADV